MDVRAEVLAAEKRIRSYIRRTPLEFSPALSRTGDASVHLKLENFQLSGSFKLRGAMNKLLSLSNEERSRGVVTASSGNHGAACAYAFQQFGVAGTIYLPETASTAKIDALRLYDAELKLHGRDIVEAERIARQVAEKENRVFLSPYNDPLVIGGQGTIGLELEEQVENIDAVIVPVGGGGLIAGIAGYLKSVNRAITVVGCQPENSAVMAHSLQAGQILDEESQPTLSDGTAGGIEQGSITFELCRDLVDDFVLLSEEEIRTALRLILQNHHLLLEGSGALSVAAFLQQKKQWKGKNVVLVLSGSKISLEALCEVLKD